MHNNSFEDYLSYLNSLSSRESSSLIPESIAFERLPHGSRYEFGTDYVCHDFEDFSESDDTTGATANTEATTAVVGIDNTNNADSTAQIFTGKHKDFVIGLASATVRANSLADARSATASRAFATANIFADAVGITNEGTIATRKGNDTIFGLAQINARSNVLANALSEFDADNNSTAISSSESVGLIDVLAIGIDNAGRIDTGRGNDLLIAVAQTTAKSQISATAIAEAFNLDLGDETTDELNRASAQTNVSAISTIQSSTFGLFNSGNIFLGKGKDLIFGVAISEGISVADSAAVSESEAVDLAIANADAEAIAVVREDTVGIVNTGKIATARGDDTIIGLAFNNQAEAGADATAEAIARATDTDTDSNSVAITDTDLAIAIGIDNSEGIIKTGGGRDSIMAYGDTVGLLGGRINTEGGDDRLNLYGSVAGAEDSKIYTGAGNDYFQAAIGELDPFTGEFERSSSQADSLVNVKVYGGSGLDTFEIGDFGGNVLLNGGKDFDTLKLLGDFNSYQFSVGSNGNSLTIEDSGSILTVKNVEAIYLGDSDRLYTVGDFA